MTGQATDVAKHYGMKDEDLAFVYAERTVTRSMRKSCGPSMLHVKKVRTHLCHGF